MKTNYKHILITAFLGTSVLSGCNGSTGETQNNQELQETAAPAEKQQHQELSENTHDAETTETTSQSNAPKEVPADAHCAFCNMVVYGKDHEMGAFSAQAIDVHGEHLFFDDSGCVLNHERKTGEELEAAWVRDYLTKEWVPFEEAAVVKSDIKTPMKYGYSFFKSEDGAHTFIEEHKDMNPANVTIKNVDEVSNKRYQMKMQNGSSGMNEKNQEHSNH